MQRRETGNTTASRVKSLLLHVQRHHGRAEADAFLLKTKLDREYLEDETRALPLDRWHDALVAFASRWGRDEIARTTEAVVDPENLGAWTRVLRGTETVAGALKQLGQHGGDEVLTDRWKTIDERETEWRGAVEYIAEREGDGLCELARATEVAAVPLLFGLRAAEVSTTRRQVEGRERLEITAVWREPGASASFVGALGLAAIVTALTLMGTSSPLWIAIAFLCSAGVGAGAGFVVTQSARRRAQVRSQLMRIQALERGAALREAREQGALALGEGAVIAGQYRLGKKLGAGASGAIYEAVRFADGRDVAIKLLRAAVAHDNLAADRLRREAAALGLAWHPNVVEVYEEGHLPDGSSYLVMERLHGESLAVRLRKRGPLSPSELLPIAAQVCDAIGAVHAAGVIHRDLKPSNIFLARGLDDLGDGVAENVPSSPKLAGGERVKLLDFGVARVEWAETRLTNMGVPLGTPGYMSPEQEQGVEIDQRADLFSLGGVLYECLTAEPPPVNSGELWERGEGTDASPSGVQRALQSIPKPWRALIDRAMAEHPRDRFADARQMKKAVLRLGEAASADPDAKSG